MNQAADDPETHERSTAFRQGLQQLGWIEGRNMRLDIRYGAANPDYARKGAAELVALAPELILASGVVSLTPLLRLTRTIPIVFAITPDPVGADFVDSLAQPGGNVTGFMLFEYSPSGKWLELLKGDRADSDASRSPSRSCNIRRDRSVRRDPGYGAVSGRGCASGQRQRSPRDRAPRYCLRAIRKRRFDRDSERVVRGSSQFDRHAGYASQTAFGLQHPRSRGRRRRRLLWTQLERPVPGSRPLRRSHSQRREARRPSGAGADQVRARDQSQDCQGARPHRATDAARARRRGDRVKRRDFIMLLGGT